MNNTEIWLERLSSLYKSQMRQAACDAGIQLVHLEILQYLSICNRYSNTAQALSEYLGQTKGSISQSLKVMESIGHLERKPCTEDGRVIRLYLTTKGKQSLREVSKTVALSSKENPNAVQLIQSLLSDWQESGEHNSFGQCQSCKFNRRTNSKFECGLTNEALSKADVEKICREHQFAENSI